MFFSSLRWFPPQLSDSSVESRLISICRDGRLSRRLFFMFLWLDCFCLIMAPHTRCNCESSSCSSPSDDDVTSSSSVSCRRGLCRCVAVETEEKAARRTGAGSSSGGPRRLHRPPVFLSLAMPSRLCTSLIGSRSGGVSLWGEGERLSGEYLLFPSRRRTSVFPEEGCGGRCLFSSSSCRTSVTFGGGGDFLCGAPPPRRFRMLFRCVSTSSAYMVIFLLFLGDGVEIIFSSRS